MNDEHGVVRKEIENVKISIAAFDTSKDFIVNQIKTTITRGVFEKQAAEKDGTSSIYGRLILASLWSLWKNQGILGCISLWGMIT